MKFASQLEFMRIGLTNKLPRVQRDLDVCTKYPGAIKAVLDDRIEEDDEFDLGGKTKDQWIDDEFEEQKLMYTWKVEKIAQSITRIENEQRLRRDGFITVLVKQGDSDRRFDPTTSESEAINSPGGRVRAPLGTQLFVDDT